IRLTGETRDWVVVIGATDVRVEGDDQERVFAIAPGPDGRYVIEVAGSTLVGTVAIDGDTVWVDVEHDVYQFRVPPPGGASTARDVDALTPPMPATVVRVNVKAGAEVEAGDVLVVLEAMKMELPIRSPRAGRIVSVECREGDLVQPGHVLVRV
ncbi:MAG TPA: biotin/lipoyl-containing protein, partial [Vicinamibacterales bacterium]|nr:biotin/lipoyl-containing protein [Vicinamibacterales bacterium]